MSFVIDSRRNPVTTPSTRLATAPIEVVCSDGRIAVTAAGELDDSATLRLKECLHDAIDDGVNRVVLDLAAVTWMDSRSLSVLVQVHARMAEIGCTLLIVGATPPTVRLFDAADLAFYLIPEQPVTTTAHIRRRSSPNGERSSGIGNDEPASAEASNGA
jgi:anti-anti-sigma factor